MPSPPVFGARNQRTADGIFLTREDDLQHLVDAQHRRDSQLIDGERDVGPLANLGNPAVKSRSSGEPEDTESLQLGKLPLVCDVQEGAQSGARELTTPARLEAARIHDPRTIEAGVTGSLAGGRGNLVRLFS
jgi:hypothetical protein